MEEAGSPAKGCGARYQETYLCLVSWSAMCTVLFEWSKQAMDGAGAAGLQCARELHGGQGPGPSASAPGAAVRLGQQPGLGGSHGLGAATVAVTAPRSVGAGRASSSDSDSGRASSSSSVCAALGGSLGWLKLLAPPTLLCSLQSVGVRWLSVDTGLNTSLNCWMGVIINKDSAFVI